MSSLELEDVFWIIPWGQLSRDRVIWVSGDFHKTASYLSGEQSCCTRQHWCVHACLVDDEFGTEIGGPSQASFGPPQPQPSSTEDLANHGPASVTPPNYNTIQVPPGSHAPANTPADLPHAAGKAWTSALSKLLQVLRLVSRFGLLKEFPQSHHCQGSFNIFVSKLTN